VLLLHGWPGFWYDWRRVLPRLAQFTSVIAPDLRGFGFSAKPDWPVHSAYSPEAQAKNVLTLLDQLNVERIILGGYDIGSRVAQMLAHMAPERVHSLVLSAPVYPGFGTRPLGPEAQRERWYRAGGGSGQVALASGNIPPVPITHPTMILWGEADPIAPPAWADRLGDTFSRLLGVQFLPGIGHFVPFEAPEAVVEAIRIVL
jgi:pimeloyl-ACP methyl ester carboxylesterase